MSAADLYEHLASGNTTVCRIWTVTRRDGVVLGFTDHDQDLLVDGVAHHAATGLTARALQQSTGLAVDNSEMSGAISGDVIKAEDLAAGRYDGAEVAVRLVNWSKPDEIAFQFRGHLGEVSRTGSEFRAELRGLADGLNQPVGLAYTRECSAVLGDKRCRFDLSAPGFSATAAVSSVDEERRQLKFDGFSGFDDRWFESGRIEIANGDAAGLVGLIKSDLQSGTTRVVDLWQGVRANLKPGDVVRLFAGCDKRPETCRLKFGNFLNFRGFPYIPGEDWLSKYPSAGQSKTGGSLFNSNSAT